ncbi:hypothetical protein A2U01_0057131, partial [Trifolium medium]|nr:hypothetical protein [Trifolium medium]
GVVVVAGGTDVVVGFGVEVVVVGFGVEVMCWWILSESLMVSKYVEICRFFVSGLPLPRRC